MTDRPTTSRRRLLAAVGTAGASTAIAGCHDDEPRWVAADVPTDAALYDVVTAADGAYAVGEDGTVIARDDGDWTVRLESGIGGAGDGLRSAAVTSTGRSIWVAGDGGALGYYDAVADHAVDLSAPNEKTSSWSAVAAAGVDGAERLLVVNTSGELLAGRRDGATVAWADVVEPGSGSTLADIDLSAPAGAYAIDTDGGVFASTDGGRTWDRIGIADAEVDFAAVAAVDDGHVSVAGGNGTVFSYDGEEWTRSRLGEQPVGALVRDRYDALAVAVDGTVYERRYGEWTDPDRLPSGNELHAVTLGTARSPPVVVGESGTAFERRY
ncbi:WD40/YVTN/BNR-like repeat-containing protein [Halovivax limisalsi]|uniref:WD40/YVTN/BNR-like repeat-containing protein n=1 Tax=Halovivax limisalsi TaxID=1453760 RepID=UPI001FFD7498|nr:hypothetical protein [Halovivax limisalsi]